MLLVSHDRDFLDRVVTSVIAAEGDGRWIEYAGGYSDMLVQRGPPRRPAFSGRSHAGRSQDQTATAARPRKMTFKDRHALETLPARIAALQAECNG